MKTRRHPTKAEILAILQQIADPVSGRDLVAAQLVQDIAVGEDHIRIVLEVRPEQEAQYQAVRDLCQTRLEKIAPDQRAQVILTAHQAPAEPKMPQTPAKPKIDAKAIIAVASGKGGVGKSTIAVNLAIALAERGQKIGLLDADVYGPSTPMMMGISQKPEINENKKIIPLKAHGVQFISLGLFVDEERAMIWRGPMVHSAVTQMLDDVLWQNLDVLIIDMPPGTGDAQLTLAQRGIVTGVVLVSTPQDIALADVRRAAAMFKTTGIPILGIVENMAWFAPDDHSQRVYIFGEGGAKKLAEKEGFPFLAEIPVDPALRAAADSGQPGAQKQKFAAIAEKVTEKISAALDSST